MSIVTFTYEHLGSLWRIVGVAPSHVDWRRIQREDDYLRFRCEVTR